MLRHQSENGLWHKMSLGYCFSSNSNRTISMPKAIQNCIPRPCRLYLDRLYNFALLMQFTPFLNWSERSKKRTWVNGLELGCQTHMATTLLSVEDCGNFCNEILKRELQILTSIKNSPLGLKTLAWFKWALHQFFT